MDSLSDSNSTRFLGKKYVYQVSLLTLVSFLSLLPLLLKIGPNIVTITLQEGSTRFWEGLNPYAHPAIGDVFHYPPFFAMVYGFFAYLPPKVGCIAWGFLNSFIFCAGISSWYLFTKKTSVWAWIALLICSMELDISMRYQQSNALVIGLVLLALYFFKSEKFLLSGFLFALVTHLKIFPAFLAIVLLWPPNKKFTVSFFASLLLLFFTIVIVAGWDRTIYLHAQQYIAVSTDMQTRHLLDIKSCLERLGLPTVGLLLKLGVGLFTLLVFPLTRFLYPEENFPWGFWFTLTLSAFLLVLPRAESPTFVFIAPAYLFLMDKVKGKERFLLRLLLLLAMFLITFIYTDAWPKIFLKGIRMSWTSKTLGVFVLWGLSFYLITKPLVSIKRWTR
jgi:hypothetical protein